MSFDTVLILDWSGGNDTGPTPRKDAIWAAIGRDGITENPRYFRNRGVAEAWVTETLAAERAAGRRVLLGIDICFAFPGDLPHRVTGSDDPLALWDWVADRITDTPKDNNRFDVAAEMNRVCPGLGPFWGNGLKRDIADLPRKGRDRTADQPEKRPADQAAKGAFSPWQLAGAGAVGSQVLMAMPMLSRLRRRFDSDLTVWPFEGASGGVVLAEVYLTLLKDALKAEHHPIRDAAQVQLFARLFSGLAEEGWQRLLDQPATPTGWVLGVGQEAFLNERATPPRLTNDCFALPQGVNWTPVDDALSHLRAALQPVTGTERVAVSTATGRRLAMPVTARRSHPPAANSAVDGYGFAGPLGDGPQSMTLLSGRSAAGAPYTGRVAKGEAIRILTGALLPEGVDTVVLQEDVTVDGDAIRLNGPLKMGSNARKAGEDFAENDTLLSPPRLLTPADVGLLTAAGVSEIVAHKQLRVGVLSTGDELRDADQDAPAGTVYDANRPMLLADIAAWGHAPVDLGRAPDDPDRLRVMLDDAALRCDAILTSGGASSGDADHVSALLKDTGSFALWRIAMKPGRPLALGMWQGTPVFGLPGNPVAAQVCALIFAHPASSLLAGGGWPEPVAFDVPAAFSKTKKSGRREFLRARIKDGQAEVFASEGSGRISGLSWATGLVMLGDEAMTIAPGDPVRFLPFSGFGL